MSTWELGERIPASQLIAITAANTGPIKSEENLPLYHHAGIYDETVEFMNKFCETLGISPNFEGGNFVIHFGPNKGINAYRG